ncbi:MAG: hypothetical protein ABIP97_07025, partial [Chthoniobacterales bacterium]
LAHVETLAAKLATMPGEGLARTKALLRTMTPLRDDKWDNVASTEFEACYEKPEARERVAAFLTKKKKV